MIKSNFIKILYFLGYFSYLINRRISKEKENIKLSYTLIGLNNKYVMKILKRKEVKKVAILLPHCIQNYNCPYKVTSELDNCRSCGRCKLGEIRKLKFDYNVVVKIATGGTIARLFLKKERPEVAIAVACERDLFSGIYDAYPQKVYGVFNRRPNGPCIDTDVSVEEIKVVLKKLNVIKTKQETK